MSRTPKPIPEPTAPTPDLPALTMPTEPLTVYIVNRAGAVHDVAVADAADVLKRPGYRLATEGEVAARIAEPNQDSTDPIGKRGL